VFPEIFEREPAKIGVDKRLTAIVRAISFPEHARSQVKGGHSSGEIELIQACDWLTPDSTLDFQREFYASIVSSTQASVWDFSSKI
jgi:hypothetical protein